MEGPVRALDVADDLFRLRVREEGGVGALQDVVGTSIGPESGGVQGAHGDAQELPACVDGRVNPDALGGTLSDVETNRRQRLSRVLQAREEVTLGLLERPLEGGLDVERELRLLWRVPRPSPHILHHRQTWTQAARRLGLFERTQWLSLSDVVVVVVVVCCGDVGDGVLVHDGRAEEAVHGDDLLRDGSSVEGACLFSDGKRRLRSCRRFVSCPWVVEEDGSWGDSGVGRAEEGAGDVGSRDGDSQG